MQGQARMIFWCLSRQRLYPAALQQSHVRVVQVIALGLDPGNTWQSTQCVHYALACITRLSGQIPQSFIDIAQSWLPQLWRLLLAQPSTNCTTVTATILMILLHIS